MKKINLKKTLQEYAEFKKNEGKKLNIYEFLGWIESESELLNDKEFINLVNQLIEETDI